MNNVTYADNSERFQTVTGKRCIKKTSPAARNTKYIVHENRYQPLHRTDVADSSDAKHSNYDGPRFGKENNQTFVTSNKNIGFSQMRRPSIVTKENPENEQYYRKTVPENTNYADVAKKERKFV